MKKKRRSMKEISKDIEANNKRKPLPEQLNELFDTLEKEGLTEPAEGSTEKNIKDRAARPNELEPNL